MEQSCSHERVRHSPGPLVDPSLSGGGGLLPCWWGVGEGGGGGAGPRVGAGPPGVGEGAVLLLPSELWRCGSSGAASPPAGPLVVRYSGGGGAREEEGEEEAGGLPPEVGGRRLLPGEGGGLEGRGGVLPGAGGRGLSLL